MSDQQVSRRAVLAGAAAFLATPAAARAQKLKISIFSKHLPDVHGADLAKAAVDLGFDGVDLTVRKGGHVLPEQVKEKLPPTVKALRAAGLEVPMITTEIADADTPHAEDVLRTASELGIRNYRFGAFRYAADKPIAAQLDAFKPRLERLAKLNAKYQTTAMYHTHSGVGLVGAPIWDLHILMKDLDPKLVGINYDIGHAHIEGGLGGWIASWRVAGAHVRGVALKDFVWAKDDRGRWRERWCPIGEGMVHWDEFMKMVAATDFVGPVQVHFEYPLPKDTPGIYAAYKKDLQALRGYLAKAGL